MNKNSLFAILLRAPWWVSALVAAGIVALAHLVLSETFASFGKYAALPFIVIAGVNGWRQLRTPGAGRIAATLESLHALSWDDFSSALEDAFRRDGYAVSRLTGAGADLELVKSGRVTLVGCRRWKAARTGIEALKELDAARRTRDAQECIHVSAGEMTDNARAFAAGNNIRLLDGANLAKLLPPTGKRR